MRVFRLIPFTLAPSLMGAAMATVIPEAALILNTRSSNVRKLEPVDAKCEECCLTGSIFRRLQGKNMPQVSDCRALLYDLQQRPGGSYKIEPANGQPTVPWAEIASHGSCAFHAGTPGRGDMYLGVSDVAETLGHVLDGGFTDGETVGASGLMKCQGGSMGFLYWVISQST